MSRHIGLILILLGFGTSFFGLLGLTAAVFLWTLGTFLFARSFLNR